MKFKHVLKIIFKFVRALLPLILYLLALIAVKIFYDNFYDEATDIVNINGNKTTPGALITSITFLFGIILTFDIHYYDQIEPKYAIETDENEKKIDNIFLRQCKIINILTILLINFFAIVQYYTAFRAFYFLITAEQNLLIVLYVDIAYLLISVMAQITKWGENVKKDMQKNKQ